MDAIRKKMQSLKGETDTLYATIKRFEEATREFVARADQVNHITENSAELEQHTYILTKGKQTR